MKPLIDFLFNRKYDSVENDPYKYHPKTRKALIKCIGEELKLHGPNANLNCIDVSKITDMRFLFGQFWRELKNIDISEWDVSNVKDMSYMFFDCKRFNSDLSKWNVSNVRDMSYMFYNCEYFDSDISNWDVSKVRDMRYAFYNCKSFNADLSSWKVKKVKWKGDVIRGCTSLKKIPDWCTE